MDKKLLWSYDIFSYRTMLLLVSLDKYLFVGLDSNIIYICIIDYHFSRVNIS
jgi:hypothetical protein